MLWFERQVVAALSRDEVPAVQSSIESYVDGALGALPELIRAGVVAGSLTLGAWAKIDGVLHRSDTQAGVRLGPLESSPIAPVRQYVRLLRTLVIVAKYENTEEEVAA